MTQDIDKPSNFSQSRRSFVAVAAGALAAGVGAAWWRSQSQQLPPAMTDALWSAEFERPDGSPLKLLEFKNRPLVINFWATWCGPCLKEIPEFIELQNRYADKGLQFIGIAVDRPEAVATYLNSININYPILVGDMPAISIAHELGNHIDAVPFTVIVNQQGQIIHQHAGEFSKEQLLEVIKPLLN